MYGKRTGDIDFRTSSITSLIEDFEESCQIRWKGEVAAFPNLPTPSFPKFAIRRDVSVNGPIFQTFSRFMRWRWKNGLTIF